MFCLKKILLSQTLNEPLIIVLRHAQKHIYEEPTPYHCGITEEGIQQTNNLGLSLSTMPIVINTIRTSPVPRCIQTSKIIQETMGYPPIRTSFLLGNPGAYIEEERLAEDTFKKYSIFNIVHHYIAGYRFLGFRSISEGNRRLLRAMWSDLHLQKNTLYVSHDVILASFIGSLLQLPMNKRCWIDYLQGFVVTLSSDNTLNLHLENKEFKVDV